jgi:hypothetical protein
MATNESGDFLRYSESSVAPTSHGRIFHFFGKVCTKGIMDNALWYLKLWQTMTSEFGMLFLDGEFSQSHNDINVFQRFPVFG